MRSRVALALMATLATAAQSAHADAGLQFALGKYLQAYSAQNASGQLDAELTIKSLAFPQTQFTTTNTFEPWTAETRKAYESAVREIDLTLMSSSAACGEIALALQIEWERQALVATSRHHMYENAAYQTKNAAEFIASTAIMIAVPSSAMGGAVKGGEAAFANGSKALTYLDRTRKFFSSARSIMGLSAGLGGATALGSAVFMGTAFPASPAEIMHCGMLVNHDLGWQEARQAQLREFAADGVGLGTSIGFGILSTKAIAGMGGIGAVSGGSAIAATGIGAIVLIGGGVTYVVAKEITHDKLEERRRQEVLATFRNAYNAYRTNNTSTTKNLMQAAAELEAFFYRDLLILHGEHQAERAPLLGKRDAQFANVDQAVRDKKLGLEEASIRKRAISEEADQDIAPILADFQKGVREFWEKQIIPAGPEELNLLLESYDEFDNWNTQSDPALLAAQIGNDVMGPLKDRTLGQIQSYQDLKSFLNGKLPTFRTWLAQGRREVLQAIAQNLRNAVANSPTDSMAEIDLSDPAGVYLQLGATFLLSPEPVIRKYGAYMILRARKYFILRKSGGQLL